MASRTAICSVCAKLVFAGRQEDIAFVTPVPSTPINLAVQGNCTNSKAADVLNLSEGDAAALFPLKPRQCVMLLHDTLLTVKGGSVWIDNLYLMRRTTFFVGESSFIRAGLYGDANQVFSFIAPSNLFITNVTFQSGRNCEGVSLGENHMQLYMSGVIHSAVLNCPALTCWNTTVCIRNSCAFERHLTASLMVTSSNQSTRPAIYGGSA